MSAELFSHAPWLVEGECGYSAMAEHGPQFTEADVMKCPRQAVYELVGEHGLVFLACPEHTRWARAKYGSGVHSVVSL